MKNAAVAAFFYAPDGPFNSRAYIEAVNALFKPK
jgi:hypothetical protein